MTNYSYTKTQFVDSGSPALELKIKTFTERDSLVQANFFSSLRLLLIHVKVDGNGDTEHDINITNVSFGPPTANDRDQLEILTVSNTPNTPPHRIIVDVDDATGGQ